MSVLLFNRISTANQKNTFILPCRVTTSIAPGGHVTLASTSVILQARAFLVPTLTVKS